MFAIIMLFQKLLNQFVLCAYYMSLYLKKIGQFIWYLSNKYHYFYIACVDRVKPEAYGPKTQYGRVGGTVSFTCTGDFGCNSDDANDVSWYDENYDTLDDGTLFPRYNVTNVDRYYYI